MPLAAVASMKGCAGRRLTIYQGEDRIGNLGFRYARPNERRGHFFADITIHFARRQYDDRSRPAGQRPQLPQKLDAGSVRHAEIEDDKLNSLALS